MHASSIVSSSLRERERERERGCCGLRQRRKLPSSLGQKGPQKNVREAAERQFLVAHWESDRFAAEDLVLQKVRLHADSQKDAKNHVLFLAA